MPSAKPVMPVSPSTHGVLANLSVAPVAISDTVASDSPTIGKTVTFPVRDTRRPATVAPVTIDSVIGNSSVPDVPMPSPRPTCRESGRYSTLANSVAAKHMTTMSGRRISGLRSSATGMIGCAIRVSQWYSAT